MSEVRSCCRPSLKREVLPPGSPSSGLAVIIVAAATMFFAVGSSAFILQARMRAACPYEQQQPAPVRIDADLPAAGTEVDCTEVVHSWGPDGRRIVTVWERPCP